MGGVSVSEEMNVLVGGPNARLFKVDLKKVHLIALAHMVSGRLSYVIVQTAAPPSTPRPCLFF